MCAIMSWPETASPIFIKSSCKSFKPRRHKAFCATFGPTFFKNDSTPGSFCRNVSYWALDVSDATWICSMPIDRQ